MIETISADCAEKYIAFHSAIDILKNCSDATVCAYDTDAGYMLVSLGDDYNRKVDREIVAKLAAALEISLHKWAEEEKGGPCDCCCGCDDEVCDEEQSFKETISSLKEFLQRIEDDMK